MSDTTNPGLTKATRRFGAGRPEVAPFARFEGTSAWRKDRRRVRAYARFRAAAKQASQDTKTLSALDDRGGRDAAEHGRELPVRFGAAGSDNRTFIDRRVSDSLLWSSRNTVQLSPFWNCRMALLKRFA